MGYRLGVDLGTTWTAAAVFDGDRPTMVGLGNRALQIPSVVFVPSAGEVLVGEAAERRAVAEPGRVAREFKRRMADPIPLYIDGRPYSPRALTAELLRWVVARASERLGARPAELTLTYPANWGSYRRGLLDEVCASAGLDGLAVTYRTEPEAAAAQYVYRSAAGAEGSLLVYDLGGGTFDVCVLEAQDGTYSIVGQPAGLDDLGGIDFDEMIFARVIERHAPEDLDNADPATVAALNRLRRECIEAKEALSSDVDVTIPVILPGVDTSFRLPRREFEEMIRPEILKTVEHTRNAIRASGTGPSALRAIVLVGGSSRIPLVSELLYRELGVPVAVDTHPKHDVALGAALPQQQRTRPGGRTAGPGRSMGSPEAVEAPREAVAASTVEPATLRSDPADDPASTETSTTTTVDPRRRPSRLGTRTVRRLLVVALVLAVGAAAFVIRGFAARDHQAGGTAGAASSSSPSSSPAASALTLAGVPRSATPLGDDTLVWPRVRDGVWGIGTVSLAGRQTSLARDPSLDSSFPVLSPDRRSVIYLRETTEQWSLRIVAADGGGDQVLLGSLAGCRQVQAPAWGSQGLLALPCQKSSGSGTVLELVTLDGQVKRILDRGILGDPSFSKDGRTIVYWRNDYGSADGGALFRISADGGTRQRLTVGGDGVDNDPVISPDGKTVAYRTKRNGRLAIATIALGSTASTAYATPRVIDHGDVDEQEPSWSPDGKKLAFVRGLGDDRDIYIMNPDGTGTTPLVEDDEADAAPAWISR